MASNIFSGCMPAVMTPCKADRTPDYDALVRKGQELIAAGMSAVVYCGSMGDWPLLTDEQRMEGVERLVRFLFGLGHPDVVDHRLGFGLFSLGKLVEDVRRLVHPAALFSGVRINFGERLPESQCAIPDRQLGIDNEPATLHVQQQFAP